MFQEFNADNHVFFKISSYKIRDKKQMVGKVGIILYIMNVTHQFFFFFIHYVKSRIKQRSVCAMSTIYIKVNSQMAIIMLKKTLYFNLVNVINSQSFVILPKYTCIKQMSCVIIKVQQEFRLMLTYYLIYKISQIYCQIFTNAS